MPYNKKPITSNYNEMIRFKNYEKGKKYYAHFSFDNSITEHIAKYGTSCLEILFRRMPDWLRTPQYIPLLGTFKMISIETSNEDKDIEFIFEKQ